MPIPTATKLPPDPSFSDLVNKLNWFAGEFNNLMLTLDSLNVVSLTADHIDAGTINADLVTILATMQAGASIKLDSANGLVINNGLYDTFKADYNGYVTMTGARVQSKNGSYPYVVMEPTSNLFGAYTSPTDYIAMQAQTTLGFTFPYMEFNYGADTTYMYQSPTRFGIESETDIFLDAGVNDVIMGSNLRVSSWSDISTYVESLQDVINDLQNQINNHSHSGSVTTDTGTYPVVVY